MILIEDKKDCCGCGACAQRCPKGCISMREDAEGFLYPLVDLSRCIDCGLCEKVCPVLHQDSPREPLAVYAAKNPDEGVRMSSSSGGIFTLLAEQTLSRSGVVFGARFNERWEVVHGYTETVDGLAAFRGSKYVQSRMGDSYRECEQFLKQGREVLFSGTPCQIAGLRRYLGKDYERLLTVDFICHGVPSPGVFRHYLEEITAKIAHKNNTKDIVIHQLSFRDKRLGWKKFSFSLTYSISQKDGGEKIIIHSESKYKNIFLKGFLRDLYLRPSCHACPAKAFKSGSDMTIGDFWAINTYLPGENDHHGHSLCMDHANIKLPCTSYKFDRVDVYQTNSSIYSSSRMHKYRDKFFCEYAKGNKVISLIDKYAVISFKKRIQLLLANLLNN